MLFRRKTNKSYTKIILFIALVFFVFFIFSFEKPVQKSVIKTLENVENEYENKIKEIESLKEELKTNRKLRNKEKDFFNLKEEAEFQESKIIKLEDDEEEVTFYTGIEIEKDEIQIKKKEYMIQRTEFDLAKLEQEKEKPEKTYVETEEENTLIDKKKREIEKLAKELNKQKRNLQIKKEISEDEGKIDLIYSWAGITKDLHKRNRYNYELQFSLRAVAKYLPWLNKIYILINSDTTYPYWLKPQDELDKIVILDRCQFFENEEDCPTYNSFAVYSIVHRIPGLSNKFILIDDDFFFNQPVKEDYFFSKNDLPICYEPRKLQRTYRAHDKLLPVAKEKGYPRWKYARYTHRPKPHRRDFILKFEEQYPTFLEFVQSHKVRHKHLVEDLSVIYLEFYYTNSMMKKLPKKQSKFYQTLFKHEDDIGPEFENNYETLTTRDLIVFNVNDDWSPDNEIYQKQRKVLWNFFNKMYPEVPDFEIPNPDHEANT
ncbi:hypothetical protein M0812_12177 [Anaeramoeba flamelloides]|uniref:Stealth protein CR2 conserved region 2 domain-containing protein n=1 Tax=Anaeramoeba flamelloides TaxID=1746091 RepID=A0AAV7ZPL1_9EUKA|nr:hypothetical protein M0812_12177 [Anaeramoeba flamelloides]